MRADVLVKASKKDMLSDCSWTLEWESAFVDLSLLLPSSLVLKSDLSTCRQRRFSFPLLFHSWLTFRW
jgi:hypothetical protein